MSWVNHCLKIVVLLNVNLVRYVAILKVNGFYIS